MDPYLFCLCLSFGGLVLMALIGFSQQHASHGHGSHHGHWHGGKASGHKTGARTGGIRDGVTMAILGFFSPRFLFSVLMGVGVTGLLLESMFTWSPAPPMLLAVAGGLAFEHFLAGPFWRLLFGFASKPARTLETLRFEAGEAVTDFDRTGHGLVLLELDGQVRQVLGTLASEERTPDAPRVRTGERLFIHSVDRLRNTCTVSRLGC